MHTDASTSTSTSNTSHPITIHNHHNNIVFPQNVREELREVQDLIQSSPIATPDVPSSVPRATISRSTYFRAKRNLRCNNAARVKITRKNIGRPQKLSTEAEKVSTKCASTDYQIISSTLAEQPTVELKQLQQIINDKCGIEISLASISRRLKSWGCSASQTTAVQRRLPRPRAPMVLDMNVPIDLQAAESSPSLLPMEQDDLDAQIVDDMRRSTAESLENDFKELGAFPDLSNEFDPDLDVELASYESPEMNLDILQEMQGLDASYADLDPDKMTEQDMYRYQFDEQHLPQDFYNQTQLLYDHDLQGLPRFSNS